jgi:O-acetyl-ADP-ribose deacetylase (regulator of RNase III)
METRIVLVDKNPAVVKAFHEAFAAESGFDFAFGSLLDQKVDAWVSPTNGRGDMSGGLDGAIRSRLGVQIQTRVKAEIRRQHGGFLPVGFATCVPTGRMAPAYLISTPTMSEQAADVSATMNAALACCAALQAIVQHNREHRSSIRSVAMPGLGTGTGRVSPELCADLMYTAFKALENQHFSTFQEARAALEAVLGPVRTEQEEAQVFAARAQAIRSSGISMI